MSQAVGLGEIISRIKESLKQGGYLMDIASELMIISQLWIEDGRANVIVWMPDIDPQKGLKYVQKKIVYDLENDQIIEIRDVQH
ncbi:MAG: hypothetical protein F7C38_02800 [Desulfurococcales archaeon]|nr:hypothetical protein [Desulfurococcales archaeon]